MKTKIIAFLALLMMGTAVAKAQRTYALLGDNNTLYFDYSSTSYRTGISYDINGNRVKFKKIWSDFEYTGSQWLGDFEILDNVEKAVFLPSFKQVFPTSTDNYFKDMYSLEEIEGLENLNTSQVEGMMSMFESCRSLTSLDVSKFDTKNVTDMMSMFKSCESLTSLDVSNFDTKNVTYMQNMFDGCESLTSLDVSKFDTKNVKNMSLMFYGCESLTSLDLSSFKTTNLNTTDRMFHNCSNLTTIYCNDTWTANSSYDMFKGCTSLVGGHGKTYNESDIDVTFANPGENGYFTETPKTAYALWCSGNKTLYFVNTYKEVTVGGQYDFTENNAVTNIWSGTDVTNSGDFNPKWINIVEDYLQKVVFDESFKTVKPQSTNRWFNLCRDLGSIEGLEYLDTSEVIDMAHMFYYCSGLSSLDVSGFKTENVTDMSEMFSHCTGLSSLDVNSFNTEKVTDMSGMFMSCSGLTKLDVSNFNTEKVINMYCMFGYCDGLKSLDLSNFNTENVEYMLYMFQDCSNLKTIYCNNTWTTNSSDEMFRDCTSLVGGHGKTYNASDIDVRFANPGEDGYFTLTKETLQGVEYEGEYWATYYNSFAGRVADDKTTVYVARLSDDQTVLNLTEVEDKTINPGEAVILKSSAEKILLTISLEEGTGDFRDNSLSGMDKAMPKPTDEGTIYTLSTANDNGKGYMAFRQFGGNELAARKAYLAINSNINAPIRIVFGDATDISTTNFTNDTNEDNIWYDLSGRQLNGTPTSPGLYIVNGHKILVK